MGNIQHYLTNISLATYVIIFIGGVATSLTPCVYPVIPIIVGVIGAAGEKSRWKSFSLSFVYVLGMAFTFSILGMAAAMTGTLFGRMQSSPLAHMIVGNIMILFGLALLGVISLPTHLLSRVGAGKIKKRGTIFSVFFMGAASAFVAAPCTAAVLAALLAYAATTQNIVAGFTLLFTFAMGLGVFLILVGTFAGILTTLPKSEPFMRIMEKVIAFGMIILGEYFIFRAGLLSI